MTDWDQWYACDVCHALLGQACFDLSSGGPQALPPRYREVPHSCRKPWTAVAPVDRPPAPELRPKPPAKAAPAVRRRSRSTESTADAWRALAEKRRRNA